MKIQDGFSFWVDQPEIKMKEIFRRKRVDEYHISAEETINPKMGDRIICRNRKLKCQTFNWKWKTCDQTHNDNYIILERLN